LKIQDRHKYVVGLNRVVMTTATGNYKLFKMEKTEKVEVREFEMRTKELNCLDV
jgi:hypothetical protein